MKKWFALALIAVLAVLTVASVVSAQAPQPQSTPQPGFGRGGMMGQGRMAQGQGLMAQYDGDEGPIHDGMLAAFAAKLGLKAEDLQARLDKGESMWQIASAGGMSAEQFSAAMLEARNAGIDAAVKNGTLSQEQADWMKQRGQMMGAGQNGMDPENCPMNNGTTGTTGAGRGGMMRRGGMMGRGQAQGAQQ
jgi:hypothetical protein